MKLLDKLKNALFEEEYVEVEESVLKEKKEKKKIHSNREKEPSKLKSVKVTNYDDEDVPVARKIAPVKNEDKVKQVSNGKREERVSKARVQREILEQTQPIKVTEIVEKEEPAGEVSKPKIYNQEKYENDVVNSKTDSLLYQKSKKNDNNVGLYKASMEDEYIKSNTANEYGNYEKNKTKKVFKASPNISPIYGIIDDNGGSIHKPVKQEVRLTSAIRNDRVDVDDVRRKAYGTLVDDLNDKFTGTNTPELRENLMIDLRENNAPEVNKVTIEDAEEYFEDLGLEYDTDYIDANKARASGRRLKSEESYNSPIEEHKDSDEESSVLPETSLEDNIIESRNKNFDIKEDTIDTDKSIALSSNNKEVSNTITNNTDDDDLSEDNLFDLIDSMYDK